MILPMKTASFSILFEDATGGIAWRLQKTTFSSIKPRFVALWRLFHEKGGRGGFAAFAVARLSRPGKSFANAQSPRFLGQQTQSNGELNQ
jgi:hypothetical protein